MSDEAGTSGSEGSPEPTAILARFSKAVFNYGLGAVLPKILAFLLIPIYTTYLSPADYGILDLAASLGLLLMVTMRFGLPGAVTRFYYDFGEGPRLRNYVTTVGWVLVASSLGVAGLVLAIGPWTIERLLPGLSYFPYVVLVVLATAIEGPAELQRRLIRAREQSAYSARLTTVMALVTLSLTLFFVAGLRWGAMGHLLGSLLASSVFLLQAVWYLRRDLKGSFRWALMAPSFAYAGGILPSHLVGNIEPVVTRSILTHTNTLAAVGLLAVAVRFTQPLTILQVAFNSAYEPFYYSTRLEETPESLEKLRVLGRSVWCIALGAALAVALLGPIGVELMTPASYHGAAWLVPILTLAFLSRVVYNLLGMEIFFTKRTFLVPLVSLASAVAVVGTAALTARAFGAAGVAWATVAGAFTAAVLAAVAAASSVRLPHDWWSLGRSTGLAGGVLALHHLWPGTSLVARLGSASAALLAFPLLLWITGDPTVREVVASLGRQLRRRPPPSNPPSNPPKGDVR